MNLLNASNGFTFSVCMLAAPSSFGGGGGGHGCDGVLAGRFLHFHTGSFCFANVMSGPSSLDSSSGTSCFTSA